jgi:hypothetical protein
MKKMLAVLLAQGFLGLVGCGKAEAPVDTATTTTQPENKNVSTRMETDTVREESSTRSTYVFYPDDPPDPLGNWLGLHLQSEEDRASFLHLFGYGKTPAFFKYDNDGQLQLELYYDTAEKEGVGVYHHTDFSHGMAGFRVGAPEKAVWMDHTFLPTTEFQNDDHVFELASLPGNQEYRTYNQQNRPLSLEITTLEEELGERTRISINWHYRKDGTLRLKCSYYNSEYYGTGRHIERFYYDAKERLIYTSAYITSGSMEDYYRQPPETHVEHFFGADAP